MSKQTEKIKQNILERYVGRTKKSKEYYERAKEYLPGGDTRSAAFYKPYPFSAESGNGCIIRDVDGNGYIDFVNNFSSLIHGHANPEVVKAIEEQIHKGFAHGTPIEQQYQLSKLLCERIPSIELIRYCNSGSEATLYAMRAARCFTGRDGFIRMDGGYNGCHDFAEVNITPDLMTKGMPTPKVEKGIPKSVLQDIHVVPFNDLEAMESVLKQHSEKLAGIIMEPMLGSGGLIMPAPGYLKGVRELATKYGVLLIIDEVITFRLHEGGLHTMEGIKADLVSVGKIMGGGFPVGAFGGRKDIMKMFDPSTEDFVTHSGTFSGNAMTMTAGLAAMKLYTRDEINRINALGDRMRNGILKAYKDTGVAGNVNGWGSIVGITFTNKTVKSAKEVVLEVLPKRELLGYAHLSMLCRGVYYIGRGMWCISTAMKEKDIDYAVGAFRDTLEEIKPLADECNA